MDVPCNLQHVIIILQRVVDYTVRPQRPSIYGRPYRAHYNTYTFVKRDLNIQNRIDITGDSANK